MTPEEQFVQKLVDAGILTSEEGQHALLGFSQAKHGDVDDTVTTFLTSQGKLTEFQVGAIRQGKFKELVIGNYVILDRLGSGGMGTVFKARHRRMKRVVAIKVMASHLTQNPMFVQRFQREVEAVARLNHPNIMLAFDADESEVGHFLVMEFIDGEDLANMVKRHGPLTLRDAVNCIIQSARALEYAHAQGIVHRDIKPANLMRDKSGVVKVMDLGLARFTNVLASPSGDSSLTQDGAIAGTVDFMAPEQALNTKTADHRADIYSLGCTLHHLLTGQHLFGGDTVLEKILAHREQLPRSICEIRRDVPKAIDEIFFKMVAKRPTDRVQSMSAVVQELELCSIPDHSVEFVPGHAPGATEIAATTDETSQNITIAELTVMIVEPSRTQSAVITTLLRKLGTRNVQCVKSGQEVIDALHASPPQLIISAMHLPDMTGLDLLAALRDEPTLDGVSFILVSSENDCPGLDSIGSLNRLAVLPKPFDAPLLSWAMTIAVDGLITQSMMLPKVNVSNARVLLVDDSLLARAAVRKILESVGLKHITEANNGRQARDLLDSNPFDLVVSDYNMPEMDGEALLKYIRWQSSQRSIPVIMVTTETDERRRAAVRHLGVSALSDKNLDPQLVRAALVGSLAL